MIQYGSKVRMVKVFTDEFGFVHPEGERGEVLWVNKNHPNHAGVEFDGYEVERAADKELWRTRGEGNNVVPGLSEVPLDLLVEDLEGRE